MKVNISDHLSGCSNSVVSKPQDGDSFTSLEYEITGVRIWMDMKSNASVQTRQR